VPSHPEGKDRQRRRQHDELHLLVHRSSHGVHVLMSTRRFAPLVSVASVAASAIAACYGAGPEPTAPSSAKIVWRAPAGAGSCSATYVGSLAVTATTGYAV